MLITWMFVALLAEASGGQVGQTSQASQINQANQAIVVPLSDVTMTCVNEGDHLVCVIPLDKESAQAPQHAPAPAPAPKARAYGRTQSPRALPGPEAWTQLKAAEANIELAKALLPKATTPEEAVLSQQLLYRAKEQYRTARALLHTVQGDLDRAPDPFDSSEPERDANAMAMCQGEADVAEECNTAAP